MNTLEISLPTFRAALAALIPCVSTDETRPHLNSVLFDVKAGQLTIVSTDGHRLARWDDTTENTGSAFSFQVSLKVAKELYRLAGDKGITVPTVILNYHPEFKEVAVNLGVVSARYPTVDQQFPPYEQIMPRETGEMAQFNAGYLCDAAKAFKDAWKALGNRNEVGVYFESSGEYGPSLATSETLTQLRVVIMPMRGRGAPANSLRAGMVASLGTKEAAE